MVSHANKAAFSSRQQQNSKEAILETADLELPQLKTPPNISLATLYRSKQVTRSVHIQDGGEKTSPTDVRKGRVKLLGKQDRGMGEGQNHLFQSAHVGIHFNEHYSP